MEWVPCGDRYIDADVIRWREAIWKPKTGKKSRPRKIGERLVTAEVVKRESGGWVRLKIRQCETTNAEDWIFTIPPVEIQSVVRRQAATIKRGKPARLEWTEEEARQSVLGVKKPPLSRFQR